MPYSYSELLRNTLEPSPSDRATLQEALTLLSASSGKLPPITMLVATERDSPQTSGDTEQTSTRPSLPKPALLPHAREPEQVPADLAFEPEQASEMIELPHFLMTGVKDRSRKSGNRTGNSGGVICIGALRLFQVYTISLGRAPCPDASLVEASLNSVREELIGTKHTQAYEHAGVTAAPQSEAQQEVFALLDEWVSSSKNRDVEVKMQCYTPLVDRYYGQRRIPVSRLHEQVEDVLSRIGTVRKFDIRNIQFARLGPEWAVVSFDNESKFGGNRPFEGSVRNELVLHPVEGRWKITGQRELKVYWTNR